MLRLTHLRFLSDRSALAGTVSIKESLSFVATMYRSQDGSFEPKRYSVIIQVPHKPGSTSTDKLLLFGTADVDLASYAVNIGEVSQAMRVEVPVKLPRGRNVTVTGAVSVSIVQAKMALDGMTNMSHDSSATGGVTESFMDVDQARCLAHPKCCVRH
jgi:hypothetical protein